MNLIDAYVRRHPVGARVIPFAVFLGLTILQGNIPSPGHYWLYLIKVIAGGWLLWLAREALSELEWRFSVEAIVAGFGVFVLWVGLDPLIERLGFPGSYPRMKSSGPAWNPVETFGDGSLAAWVFIAVRLIGSGFIVPMLEEIFYRSFVYRYIEKQDFLSIPLSTFIWRSFLFTALIFASTHVEWLAAILTAFVYQGLVCWKGRLGDAITAHAITNILLGGWVVWKNAWHFW